MTELSPVAARLDLDGNPEISLADADWLTSLPVLSLQPATLSPKGCQHTSLDSPCCALTPSDLCKSPGALCRTSPPSTSPVARVRGPNLRFGTPAAVATRWLMTHFAVWTAQGWPPTPSGCRDGPAG